jgi:hypothetical protein
LTIEPLDGGLEEIISPLEGGLEAESFLPIEALELGRLSSPPPLVPYLLAIYLDDMIISVMNNSVFYMTFFSVKDPMSMSIILKLL